MSQELGRIDRPSVDQYQGRRKLLLVPLVYAPQSDIQEGAAALQNYWDQMQTQVAALETALGGLQHIYHESLTVGGSEGLEQLGATDQRSHRFIQDKCQAGAVLQATEDLDALLETLDLQRCLMMPLASPNVASKLQEWHTESNRKRYEYIASQIDATLGEDAVGLLMISERHQVQFPGDIEVFYVSPPALDEYRRWIQNWVAQQQQRVAVEPESALEEEDAEADEEEPESEETES